MIPVALIRPAVAVRVAAACPTISRATFLTTARVMAEGDTGAPPKTGGSGDAFQRRERAAEDMAIRQREREKLMELKRRIAEQQDHLKKLSDHIDDITSEGEPKK